jgi:hypothetical protein
MKLLFIVANINQNTDYGIRTDNYIKHLKMQHEIDAINLSFHYFLFRKRNKIVYALVMILRFFFIFPDLEAIMLKRYKKEIDRKFSNKNYDMVIIRVTPYSILKLSKHIKKRYNCKISLDLSDPITKNIIFEHYIFFRKYYLQRFEDKYIKYIDELIACSPEIKEYYMKKYTFIPKIKVIEQGFDSNNIEENHINLKENHPLKLIYAGQLYRSHREPFELYKAIKSYNSNEILLKMYGNYTYFYFSPPKTDHFYQGGHINQKALLNEYIDSDIIVFIDNKDTLQVPGKSFEILSLNKPILFIYYNSESPTINYFKEYDGIEYCLNRKYDIINAINNIKKATYTLNRDVSKYLWINLSKKLVE